MAVKRRHDAVVLVCFSLISADVSEEGRVSGGRGTSRIREESAAGKQGFKEENQKGLLKEHATRRTELVKTDGFLFIYLLILIRKDSNWKQPQTFTRLVAR